MSSQRSKTIAAIATPQGYGGIGVVRISGDLAADLTRRLLRNGVRASFSPNQASFHHLVNPEAVIRPAQVIDQQLGIRDLWPFPRFVTLDGSSQLGRDGHPA